MKDVYIEFTRPKSKPLPLFSWAIRLVENTEYSHVRLRWETSWGTQAVYEASGTSVKFLGDLAIQQNPATLLHSFKVTLDDIQYRRLLKLCMDNAGLDYGYLQILGMLLVKLFFLKRNPLSRGRKSQVCSEIVGRFLQEILKIGNNLELDIAGPKDIYSVLEENTNIVKVIK